MFNMFNIFCRMRHNLATYLYIFTVSNKKRMKSCIVYLALSCCYQVNSEETIPILLISACVSLDAAQYCWKTLREVFASMEMKNDLQARSGNSIVQMERHTCHYHPVTYHPVTQIKNT